MLTYAAVPYHSHRTPVTASCGSRVYSEQTDIARLPPGSPLWKEGVPHVKPTIKARTSPCAAVSAAVPAGITNQSLVPRRTAKTKTRTRSSSLSESAEATLRRIFQSVDVNGDGRINKREMIKFCRASPELAASLGFPTGVKQEGGTRDLLEARFQAMDRDDNREVTWEEFFDFFSAEMEQAAQEGVIPGVVAVQRSVDGLSWQTERPNASNSHVCNSHVSNTSAGQGSPKAQSWMRDFRQQERKEQELIQDSKSMSSSLNRADQAEQERIQAQEEAFEKEFEQKHKAWEELQERAKDDEAEARQAIMEAAEKLLQDLSDNPFELIPRPSEVSVVEQVASLLQAAADTELADYSRALRLLHKESARNLERFKFHLRMQIDGFDADVTTPDVLSGESVKAEASSECGGCQLEAFQHDMLIRAPASACRGSTSGHPGESAAGKGDTFSSSSCGPRPNFMPADVKAPAWASSYNRVVGKQPSPASFVHQEAFGCLGDPLPCAAVGNASSRSQGVTPPSLLRVGSDTLPGRKAHKTDWTNQDASLAIPLGCTRMLVGVFDGHGEQGHEISASVSMLFSRFADALAKMAEDQLVNPEASVPRQMAHLFAMAQDGLERGGLAEWSGTTATLALIDAEAGVVICAHVGDSRMVICHQQKVLFETVDHDIDDVAECRMAAAGGEVRQMLVSGIDARRVFLKGTDVPGLAMSRALGDAQARGVGVISEPEISTCLQLPSQSAVILASDGVWEKVTSQEAAAITAAALKLNGGEQGASIAAKALVSEARSRWIQQGGDVDDITAVVIEMGEAEAQAV